MQCAYIVQIKSGFSTLNETADVVLSLFGDDSSMDWVLLTCDNDRKPFRTGQLDTFYIPMKKLGKVRFFYLFSKFFDFNYIHRSVL